MEASKRLIWISLFRFCMALSCLSRVSSQENSSTSISLTEKLLTTSVAKITVSNSTSKPNAATATATATTATRINTSTVSSHSKIISTTTRTKTTITSPTILSSNSSSSISSTTNWTVTSDSTSSSTLTSGVSPSSSPVPTPESSTVAISVNPTANNNNNSNIIIIGVVVGVGGAILLAALVTVVVCWCRKSKFKVVKTKSPSSATPSLRQNVRVEKPIKVSDFLDYVSYHQRDISSYRAEFDSLPGGNHVGKSSSRATQQQNARLNRYINILPFDDTLVPLNKSFPQQGYINASFVDGYKKEKAYIAAQAPVADSIGDFWLMIWEHNSSIVIMATNLFECGRPKCDKYWPNVDDSVTYGSIKVEGVAERSYGDYILRTFQVEKQVSWKEKLKSSKSVRKSTDSLGEKQELVERRNVLQFHFTTWPDQGVPNTCSSLLKFYRHALKKPPPGRREDGPIVIHCSAGVGRTGTLMAVDFCLGQAKDEGTVDVPKCIDTMRRQRMFMVQTVEQFIFIHHVLLEALTLDKVEIPCSQFDPVYRQIAEPGLLDGLSRIQREYKVLDVLKPRYDGSHSTVAQKNQEKNRHSTLLPVDTFLPYIKSQDGQNDVYVNAVHVCGYSKKRYDDDDDDDDDDEAQSLEYNYIATQSPMRETIEDFWTMIRETGSSTIVMLNELEGVEKYWPEDGRTVEYGAFVVTNMGEISSEDIRMTDLQVTFRRNSQVEPTSSVYVNDSRRSTRHDGNTFNLRHFRLITWPDPMPRETVLMSLYSEALRCQERNPNRPVVVHCLYGVERCGLFCGVMNVIDAIRHDAEVDVFNAVKRIRRTRPEFIEDSKQYKYLYDVAMEQIRSTEKIDKETTMGK